MSYDPQKLIQSHFEENQQVIASVFDALNEKIAFIGDLLSQALKKDRMIMWCGNGGSASDSQHLAAELVGRFKNDRKPLRSVALNTDTSVMTCIANDYGFEDVFSRQVSALGRKDDILIAISTSGNSENVIRAVQKAREMGIVIVGFLGKDGGKLLDLCDHPVVIPSMTTARIQESHILIGHILCDYIEHDLGLV